MRLVHPLALVVGLALVAPSAGRGEDATAPAASSRSRRPSRGRAASPVASFPGFRMNPDGTSRCFVHVSAPVTPTVHASGRRFEVLLPGVSVRIRNHLNPLETRFFDTPMLRARLERRRRDVALVIELRADVTPTMHVEEAQGGGVDVVVELPAGDFVEGSPSPGGYVRPSDEADAPRTDAPRD